ncbi:hypothetical protein [Virgibacillus halodenitrificans]|uniref:hypothetical protein n=1 Tax=Virgibacillus halodenitrificans TaxID=1482 RepID=UPI000EF43E39|nr:hypothetical protein [Virgibacillus halodenitrificans]
MDAYRLARNLIRVGKVHARKTQNGTVQVLFEDRDDFVSNDLPVLKSSPFPNIGETVVCVFLGNAIEDGFCLGPFYEEYNPPGGGT